MALTNNQLDRLKKNMETEKSSIEQNKGRLKQLKETAKAKYKVDDLEALKKKRDSLEQEKDMQLTKKNKQVERLESILPEEVKDELNDN